VFEARRKNIPSRDAIARGARIFKKTVEIIISENVTVAAKQKH
jgi:hypothetical protein